MTFLSATSIEREAAPLRRQVVDEIRKAIVTNAFPPGSRLVERVLCEQMGVSRTVVREALRELESERLIEMVPNIGSVVRVPTAQEVRSLYEVRGALESLAAADCARRADDVLLARLRAALEALPPLGSDVTDRIAGQDRFTALMIEGSGNVVIGDMLRAIHSRVSRLRALTIAVGPDRMIPGLTRILEAIESRDPDEAERRSRAYIAAAGEIAVQSIESL